MQVVYAREDFPASFEKALFLAGPTPRSSGVPSWRPAALKFLEELGYDGVVFVPEPRNGVWHGDYMGQVEWEETGLRMADCIVFWVPREMATMPGLTTNDEWGTWKHTGKVVFGAPPSAAHVSYQRYHAVKLGVPNRYILEETLQDAMALIGDGAFRDLGARYVPLVIWKTDSFQSWYANLKVAGNRLDGAQVLWTHFVGKTKTVFFWAVKADVYVTAEKRNKSNEVVLSRTSISTAVLFRDEGDSIEDAEVVLVKEFRTPVSNLQGYVYELPGGSSWKPNQDPLSVIVDEIKEEAGITLAEDRLQLLGSGQLLATMSSHKALVYYAKLTSEEIADVRANAGKVFGVEDDTERTYVEVWTVRDVLRSTVIDWSVKGMILSALQA